MQRNSDRLLVSGTRPLFVAALAISALATLTLPNAATQDRPNPPDPAIAVSVRQPRAFGYVIGDKVEQRISLLAPAGFALDPKSLPRAGRRGLWLQLAPTHLTSDKVGDGTRYRLTLDYQVINVPEQVHTIDLPAVYLVFGAAGNQVTTTVDEWPITIAPITPTYILARAGLTRTQPDTPPPTPDIGRYKGLTILWAAAIVALIAGRAVQRRGIPWLRQGARPFARAARDIGRLSRLPPERVTYRRGLQRLHRAFDAAAGHAVFGESLAPLFAAHPELLRLRPDIERFYAASQREFFGLHGGGASLGEVLALAARCRDAEAAARRPTAGGHATPGRRPHAV
jgi:mxaA protein